MNSVYFLFLNILKINKVGLLHKFLEENAEVLNICVGIFYVRLVNCIIDVCKFKLKRKIVRSFNTSTLKKWLFTKKN